MQEQELTASLEDYLEAIAELIAVSGHAHAKEIAEKMQVKMPSVTGALRQLAKKNFIIYSTHFPVQLTSEGKIAADRVMFRHSTLKQFFSAVLGLTPDAAEETACRIEHVVNEDIVRRFSVFTEAIRDRTDARALQVYLSETLDQPDITALTTLPPGTTATFDSIGRNVEDQKKLPFKKGDSVELLSFSLDHSACRVRHNGKNINVPCAIAENLYVKKKD